MPSLANLAERQGVLTWANVSGPKINYQLDSAGPGVSESVPPISLLSREVPCMLSSQLWEGEV